MMRICLFILIAGLSHNGSKATECVSRGRFPNNDEPDCRGYTMCLPTANAFMQYKLTCPLGSVYSHLEQQCTTAPTYACLSNYTCNAIGNYIIDDENCTSYVACMMGLVDLVAARRMECPVNQVFNPNVGCVNAKDYTCNPEMTTVADLPESTAVTEIAGSFQVMSKVALNSVGLVRSSAFTVMFLVCCMIKRI